MVYVSRYKYQCDICPIVQNELDLSNCSSQYGLHKLATPITNNQCSFLRPFVRLSVPLQIIFFLVVANISCMFRTIGRRWNFHFISLSVEFKPEKKNISTWYLILNMCELFAIGHEATNYQINKFVITRDQNTKLKKENREHHHNIF